MIVYETTTGKIKRIVSCSADQEQYQILESNESSIDGGTFAITQCTENYVDISDSVHVMTAKPSMNLTLPESLTVTVGNDIEIGNIPSTSTVVIDDDASYTVNDAILAISFELAGTYTVTVSCFPYLDEEITIESVV